VGPRAVLDAVVKRKIPSLRWESNHRTPIVQPAAQRYTDKNKHSLRSNTKVYGGKTHYSDSKNSDITATSGRELYHLQFSLQAASPETFGYNLLYHAV
jgi:hypothetical protein